MLTNTNPHTPIKERGGTYCTLQLYDLRLLSAGSVYWFPGDQVHHVGSVSWVVQVFE